MESICKPRMGCQGTLLFGDKKYNPIHIHGGNLTWKEIYNSTFCNHFTVPSTKKHSNMILDMKKFIQL